MALEGGAEGARATRLRKASVLEVLTTSQKLAHRITHELKKTFGGRTSYKWSDSDGALYTTWRRDDVPAPKTTARRK